MHALCSLSVVLHLLFHGMSRPNAVCFCCTAGFLHDVVTSNFPFTDIFPGVKPSNPRGYTHFDVLWNTRPGISAPYTYDYMQPESTPLAA